ncbi:hypothetical protein LCGC14_1095800 [marine sediment metagenome]|uniref:Uncharacterized protein n=1 Tax=marine sediment metagenome TaxID=412755 RepID=A0A0F9PU44_9ZZZZ
MVRAQGVIPLKIWKDWSAGVGYLKDDGVTPGMYYSSGLLGMESELRPAPFKNTATIGIDEAHHYQYFFEETLNNQTPIHDADSSGKADNSGSLTVSHTVGVQTNRVLLVWVFSDNPLITTFTLKYNGVTMTAFASQKDAGLTVTGSLYFLVDPATGANDIVLTIAPSQNITLEAASFYRASQSTPLRAKFDETGTGTSIAKTGIDSSTSEIMVMGSGTATNTTDTKVAGETLIATVINDGNDVRSTASFLAGLQNGTMTHTLGTSAAWAAVGGSLVGASGANRPGYLYGMRGAAAGTTPCFLDKLDLFNSTFATLEAGSHELTNLLKCGQPTRYQAFWWMPTGASKDPRKLTVAEGDTTDDTLAAETSGNGDDHLGNLNGQMIGGKSGSGFHILKVDGTPTTDANWGSFFPVGDKEERVAAISGLAGLSWCMTSEGLFTFNSRGKSRLAFEDFRSWKNPFDNIPMPAWKGGLFLSHPTGLQFLTPGDLPVHVGVGSKSKGLPAAGVTEFTRGRYMGTHATGEFVWAIYQPDISSTVVQIQCGYTQTGNPTDLIWQVVATSTLNDAQHLLGCFVSTTSQPLSSSYSTPVVWFGDGTDLSYVVLDQRAGPFRARADTHKVITSAEVVMSELIFPEPVDLAELVVYTQDMLSDDTDEWQMSFIVNATGNDENFAPIVQNGRNVIPLTNKLVHRLTLRVQWIATSTADRVPPTISQIELYGKPTESVVS